jgi:hypothetical protein
MLLLSAVALAGSIAVVVLVLQCCSMVRDISEAEDELRDRIQLFFRVAMSTKDAANAEIAHALHHQAKPLRRVLQEIAD